MNGSIWKSVVGQCKAELLRTIRNRRFVLFSVLMPIIFYFIFTSTVPASTKIGGVDWSAYYLMSMTAYGVIGSGITSLSMKLSRERSQGWTRLLRITPLPSWAFVVSKLVAQGILNFCSITLMFIMGAAAKGISLPAGVWIECGLWIWIGGFAFMALGSLIGTIRNTDVVQVVSTIVYIGLSLLGGLWMPTTTMSHTLQDIAKALPTYRLGQGAWSLIAGGSIPWQGILILCAYVAVCMILSSYIIRKQEAV
ncbi:ABC transporter permease [Paenibacillus humicola]|uniref:ABC transporter permease n=1 Tax=Paenibacillus humicola TaxID=3110540 RepID=UPI00237A7F36|nr:ABC transporter permease [Paenibacillus humicola]